MYEHVCHECISYMYMYSRCYLRIFFYIPVYYILSATVIIYPACTVYQSVMVSSEFFIHQQMQFSFFRKPRRPEHTKVRRIHMQFINMWMAQNPEMTAANIQGRLEKQCGIQLSKEYVCMLRRKLNWTPKHMKYGQLISHKNVKHRLDWCLDQLTSKDSFRDVIYVDESTVEMCSSGRLFFHRHGSNMDRLPAKAPKPKHSYKVNVWGGISHRGRTSICIFSGIMDSEIYQKILEDNLLPFATANYPDGFRLYQVNIKVTACKCKSQMQR